jgi:hypothetical protein
MDLFNKVLEKAQTIGNEEFVTELKDAIRVVEDLNKENTTKLNEVNSKFSDAVSSRDNLKELVRSKTGLTDITGDTLSEFFNGLKSNDPDVKTLQTLIEENKAKYEDDLKQHENKYSQREIDYEILKSGALNNIKSNVARNVVMDELKNGLVLKEGELVYVDSNGSTIVNGEGKPLGVNDKIKSLYDNEDFKPFFPVKRGGNKEGSEYSDNGSHKDLSKLSRSEKAKLMSELSPQEYQELVRKNMAK